ncbi:hypothetical protein CAUPRSCDRAFT_207, partial [Caulochytrium protostelioides]
DEEDDDDPASRSRRIRRGGELDDLDDEDDEDEEEDDEEEEDRKPVKKRRKRPANPYLDTEADDDGSDEEDEEDEDAEGFEVEEGFDEVQSSAERRREQRRHQERERLERQKNDMDAEEIAALMKSRYGRADTTSFKGEINYVPQSVLTPSVNDPKIWMVRCKAGQERDIIFRLMRKYLDKEFEPTRIDITSAFFREGLEGYIYIEAERFAHVEAAVDNMVKIYKNKYHLVPVEEMTSCLTIKSHKTTVKPGMWARLKRGKYGGDLVQIQDVMDGGDSVRVRVVPRIDYNQSRETGPGRFGRRAAPANDDGIDDGATDAEKKRKKAAAAAAAIPPARLFSVNLVTQRSQLQRTHGGYIYNGDMYDKQGYLIKEPRLASLAIENVNPTLEEITAFNGGSLDPAAAKNLGLSSQTAITAEHFQVGERIQITLGELLNMMGTVESIQPGDMLVIKPDASVGLATSVTVSAVEVRKVYEAGTHVRIVNGIHKDQTGMVVGTADNVVTIVSDTTMESIEAFWKDLRPADESRRGAAGVGTTQFAVRDAVILGPDEVGVVIAIERDALRVMNHYGRVMSRRIQAVRPVPANNPPIGTDRAGRPITVGDQITVYRDPGGAGRQASILHIYRTAIFALNREIAENNGIFVVQNHQVVAATAAKTMGPPMGMPASAYGAINNPWSGAGANRWDKDAGRIGGNPPLGGMGRGGGGMGRGGGGGGGRGRHDPMLYKTVRIIGGPWKGYLGIVRNMMGDDARVELHTGNRIITMPRGKLQLQDGQGGGSSSGWGSGAGTTGGWGTSSGAVGTPSGWGSKTPLRSAATPNPYTSAGADGGRTPAWNAGSKTPAWGVGSATPAHGGAGSKTPAWNPAASASGGADGGSAAAGEEDPYGAPASAATPHASGVPHTPFATGAYDATTPFNPPTPFAAATPAASGGGGHGGIDHANPATPFDPQTPYNPATPHGVGSGGGGGGM